MACYDLSISQNKGDYMNYASKLGTHATTIDGRKVPMILKMNKPSFMWSSVLDTAAIGDTFTVDDGQWVYTLKEKAVFCTTVVFSDTGFRMVDGQNVYIATAYEGYLLVCEQHDASMILPVGGSHFRVRKV